jgi:Uma2 family endonuclease
MDMAVGTLVSVEEYLRTSYSPDMEYVDGALVEINVGDLVHSLVQSNLVYFLRSKYPNIEVLPEVRSRTTETRFRLPDVAVLLRRQEGRFIAEAPYIAIEILSEEDRMSRVIEKLKEYAAMGVPNIWVFDPRLKQMFRFHENCLQEIEGDTIPTGEPRIELTRDEIFQD